MNLDLWVLGRRSEGVRLMGSVLLRLLARSGLHARAWMTPRSGIPAERMVLRLSTGPERVHAAPTGCGFLVAFDEEAVLDKAADASGVILFDPDRAKVPAGTLRRHAVSVGLSSTGLRLAPGRWNMAALGGLARLAGLDTGLLDAVIRDVRAAEGSETVAEDLLAAKAGFEAAGVAAPLAGLRLPRSDRKLLALSGSEALSLGALAAGCKFAAVGPAAVDAQVLSLMEQRAAEFGVVLHHAPDDAGAVGAAIGAGHAGCRGLAVVADSAGSSRAVAFAEEAEIPVVVAALGGSLAAPGAGIPSGACRAVLVPTGPADVLATVVEAFNLAERFQAPIFIMLDHSLTGGTETVSRPGLDALIDRGVWAPAQPSYAPGNALPPFDRYAMTANGVSPRAVPGHEGLFFTARGASRSKLAAKRRSLVQGIVPLLVEGPADAELTLVGSGSACGAMRHAMRHFNAGGAGGADRVNVLALRCLEPFQAEEALAPLKSARRLLLVEPGPSGSLSRLIRAETGVSIERRFSDPEGRPVDADVLIRAADEALHG